MPVCVFVCLCVCVSLCLSLCLSMCLSFNYNITAYISIMFIKYHLYALLIEFVNTKVDESDRRTVSEQLYAMSDLLHLAVLGSGTFGRVSLVQEIHTKKIFALKAMLKTEIVAHKQQNNVLNEKNVMAMCDHPFILRLYQTFKDVRKLYMLFEFVQGGELFAVIHTAKSDGMMFSLVWRTCSTISMLYFSLYILPHHSLSPSIPLNTKQCTYDDRFTGRTVEVLRCRYKFGGILPAQEGNRIQRFEA